MEQSLDPKTNKISVIGDDKSSATDISEKHFKKMKELAEILGSPFPFVRIDFFLGKKDKIYFSKYKFINGKVGKQYFSDEYELKLGKLLR